MFASLVPGTELGWGVQALGPEPSTNIYDQYRYVVFKDPNWDWKTFNFDSDVVRGDLPENLDHERDRSEHEGVLRARRQAAALSRLERPQRPRREHDQVLQERVENSAASERRPTACGCSWRRGWATAAAAKGRTCSTRSAALERWVEQGKAPDAFIASHSTNGKVDRTRPLCPYPQVASTRARAASTTRRRHQTGRSRLETRLDALHVEESASGIAQHSDRAL